MSTSTTTPSPVRRALRRRKELIMVAILAIVGLTLLIGAQTMNVLGDSAPGPQFVPVIVGVLMLVTAVAVGQDVIRHPEDERAEPGTRHDVSRDLLQDLSDTDTAEFKAVGTVDLESDGPAGGKADASAGSAAPADAAASVATDEDAPSAPVASDLRTTGFVLATLIGFVLVLPWAGWVLSGAALFWCVARALGSRNTWMDIGVALLISSIIQLIFGGLLGLSLPVLGGGAL
ncbi:MULTISPECIES: tripartite tricarboxylate transporter TctB family protein [Brachybacterium]|uniref:tripartite tricarboxylate transporter TctB family protein n=1 Tax=Brachybacterium TaxID=43668 RepID=UPI0006C2C573|nr:MULTISPECIES: tripartite tricarboxylate transporter TctB family protein [Brachybacterium]MCZ4326620.1 tripartite tricarboxylate transporter TctB family protein [Brachybacterium paraconglomeratum]GAP80490.1 tricarboxylate transport protein TctB [Brachybacterium sp. SW0106-09]